MTNIQNLTEIENKSIIDYFFNETLLIEKKVGFIITIFDKNFAFVKTAINSLKALANDCNILLLYKNNERYNYDNLIKESYFSFVQFDEKITTGKLHKMIVGSKLINTKYFITLDSDDYVYSKQSIDELINQIGDKQCDIIINKSYFFENFNNHKVILYKDALYSYSANSCVIFKSDFFWKNIDKNIIFSHIQDRNIFYHLVVSAKSVMFLDSAFYVYTFNTTSNESSNIRDKKYFKNNKIAFFSIAKLIKNFETNLKNINFIGYDKNKFVKKEKQNFLNKWYRDDLKKSMSFIKLNYYYFLLKRIIK